MQGTGVEDNEMDRVEPFGAQRRKGRRRGRHLVHGNVLYLVGVDSSDARAKRGGYAPRSAARKFRNGNLQRMSKFHGTESGRARLSRLRRRGQSMAVESAS